MVAPNISVSRKKIQYPAPLKKKKYGEYWVAGEIACVPERKKKYSLHQKIIATIMFKIYPIKLINLTYLSQKTRQFSEDSYKKQQI